MGYFKAPVDGEYQFHMSGDDSQTLWMSPTTDPMDPAVKEELITRGSHLSYRHYQYYESDVSVADFAADVYSQWITLTGG